jgi:hypothetical protein
MIRQSIWLIDEQQPYGTKSFRPLEIESVLKGNRNLKKPIYEK